MDNTSQGTAFIKWLEEEESGKIRKATSRKIVFEKLSRAFLEKANKQAAQYREDKHNKSHEIQPPMVNHSPPGSVRKSWNMFQRPQSLKA